MPSGRYAPSPTGRLHLGNLRTALVAWLFARHDGSAFHLRFEDLDTAAVRAEHYRTQTNDLAALGLDWDEPVVRQTDRLPLYRRVVDDLVAADLAYPCFCSRREIREAASAPNLPYAGHHYPGTCASLSTARRQERAAERPAAYRLRAAGRVEPVDDLLSGHHEFEIDDFVIQRNDGTPAYHLVVVIDDDEQGIELVVRGDDLLESAARQRYLYLLLDRSAPAYAHVPLVLAPDGERLAKRHGSVTLADRAARGETPAEVRSFLAHSLNLAAPGEEVTMPELLDRFDPELLPAAPLVLTEDQVARPDYAEPASDQDSSSSDTV